MASMTSSQLLFHSPPILVQVLLHLSYKELLKVQRVSKVFKEATELPMLDRDMFRGARPGREGDLMSVLDVKHVEMYKLHPIFQRCSYVYGGIETFSVRLSSGTFVVRKHAVFKDAATSPPLRRLGAAMAPLCRTMGIAKNERGVTVGQVLRKMAKFFEAVRRLNDGLWAAALGDHAHSMLWRIHTDEKRNAYANCTILGCAENCED